MDDYDLIEASFLSQYGIRLKTTELEFDEFLNLTSCLMPETPLGQIVAIRSETDGEVISNFTDSGKYMTIGKIVTCRRVSKAIVKAWISFSQCLRLKKG